MNDSERYLHIAFSAAQDPATPDSVSGEKSAGLNVTFEFMADKANSGDNDKEFELLHWYNQGYRGTLNVNYQVPMSAGKWVNYDYVFDKIANTLDIYINGYLVVQGIFIRTVWAELIQWMRSLTSCQCCTQTQAQQRCIPQQ